MEQDQPGIAIPYGYSFNYGRHIDTDSDSSRALWYRGSYVPYFLWLIIDQRQQLYIFNGKIPGPLRNNFGIDSRLFTRIWITILGDWFWCAAHYIWQPDVL